MLLQPKARMQRVLNERPLAEWAQELAPFVAEALRQGGVGRVAWAGWHEKGAHQLRHEV